MLKNTSKEEIELKSKTFQSKSKKDQIFEILLNGKRKTAQITCSRLIQISDGQVVEKLGGEIRYFKVFQDFCLFEFFL